MASVPQQIHVLVKIALLWPLIILADIIDVKTILTLFDLQLFVFTQHPILLTHCKRKQTFTKIHRNERYIHLLASVLAESSYYPAPKSPTTPPHPPSSFSIVNRTHLLAHNFGQFCFYRRWLILLWRSYTDKGAFYPKQFQTWWNSVSSIDM